MRTIVSLLFAAFLLPAQTPDGEITGLVTDVSGAVVPGATVTVTNIETNVAVPAKSNASGLYRITHLIPGTYRLKAEAQGFRVHERSPIELRVGDSLNIPVPLEVGSTAESITVSAQEPLLETNNATLGQVADTREINDLPSPGNSVLYLMQHSPGIVTTTNPNDFFGPDVLGTPTTFATLGSRSTTSQYAVDGNPIMTRVAGLTYNPPPDMVQEVRIDLNSFSASQGRFIGASINMALKTGTNQLHGTLVYSNTPKPLTARDWFTNRWVYDTRTGPITQEKIDGAVPSQRVARIRGNLGGPAVIPRLYNGRNRTFWMYGADVYGRNTSSRNTYSVPTAAQRTGDFSGLLPLGSTYQIYDPATVRAVANGRYQRDPFPGNLIPTGRLDPSALAILKYFPMPNSPAGLDGQGNWSTSLPDISNAQTHLARLDHTVNPNHRLYGSVTAMENHQDTGRYFNNDAVGNVLYRQQRGVSLNDTVVLRPDLILNLRYGLTYFNYWYTASSQGFDLSSIGLSPSLVNSLDGRLTTMPVINIAGLTTMGTAAGNRYATTYHMPAATLTYMRGSHNISAGAEYRVMRESAATFGNLSPTYTFSTNWTKGPLDSAAGAPVGQGMASFLLGLPTGGSIDRNSDYSEQSQYLGVYIQDDWKVTRRLTLNLGLRYDLDIPATERYNRSTRGFDFTTVNSIQNAAQAAYARSPIAEVPVANFVLKGGTVYAGVGGVPSSLWVMDSNNVSPRIGLAYHLNRSTVIRAGYGITFEPVGSDSLNTRQDGFSVSTTLAPSNNNGLTFQATLRDPFPNGLVQPRGAGWGLDYALGRTNTYTATDMRNGYNQRWSLSIQRQLLKQAMLETSYVGSRFTGQSITRQFDPIPNQYLSRSPVRDQATINYLSQAIPNPFYGMPQFAGTGLTGVNTTRQQLLRPMPQMTGVASTVNTGYSWYHGMWVRASRRFSSGISMEANYTFSKNMQATSYMNEGDPTPYRVIAPLDRPHVFNLSGIFDLPFGQGRSWLKSKGIARVIAGGWSIQVLYKAQHGAPLDWGNWLFIGNIKDINLPSSERTAERWFNTEAGFVKAAASQLASNIRTWPFRFVGIRASGVNSWNLSAMRRIKLYERLALELRAEAVDALNHPYFSAPNTTPTSTQFGQIPSSPANVTQRRITLVGRLRW